MSALPLRDEGYLVVEALTAIALIAVMLALTAGLVSRDAQAQAQSVDRRQAAMIARSALDEIGLASSNAMLGRTGRNGIYSWAATVEPYGAVAASAPPIERVSVTVSNDRTGRTLTRLSTLRLAQ